MNRWEVLFAISIGAFIWSVSFLVWSNGWYNGNLEGLNACKEIISNNFDYEQKFPKLLWLFD